MLVLFLVSGVLPTGLWAQEPSSGFLQGLSSQYEVCANRAMQPYSDSGYCRPGVDAGCTCYAPQVGTLQAGQYGRVQQSYTTQELNLMQLEMLNGLIGGWTSFSGNDSGMSFYDKEPRNWDKPEVTPVSAWEQAKYFKAKRDIPLYASPRGLTHEEAAKMRDLREFNYDPNCEQNRTALSSQVKNIMRSSQLPPEHFPTVAYQKVLNCFKKYPNQIPNKRCMTIIDHTKNDKKCRLFLVCQEPGETPKVDCMKAAHGEGNNTGFFDGDVDQYSNVPGSGATPKGFMLTGDIYTGKYGRSQKLLGLQSHNSKTFCRTVVFHGWPNKFNLDIPPITLGCPAVFDDKIDHLIDQTKGGSLVYVHTKEDEASGDTSCPNLNFNQAKNPPGRFGQCQ